jgi:hypothetical protein
MATFCARVSGVTTGTTTRTLVQVIPGANTPVRVVEIGISFASVTSTDAPVLVELVRQSTGGTASALTVTNDQESSSKTVVATARSGFSSTEPTTGDVIRSWDVTPIGGTFVVQFPLGREPDALTNRIALRVTAAQTQTAAAYLSFEE